MMTETFILAASAATVLFGTGFMVGWSVRSFTRPRKSRSLCTDVSRSRV